MTGFNLDLMTWRFFRFSFFTLTVFTTLSTSLTEKFIINFIETVSEVRNQESNVKIVI